MYKETLYRKNMRKAEPSMSFSSLENMLLPKIGERLVMTLQADSSGKLYAKEFAHYPLDVAVSCLIQPQDGDKVYLVVDSDRLFITDILSRDQADSVLVLSSQNASLHIKAPEIELHGQAQISFYSPKLNLISRCGSWITETLDQVSQRLFVRSRYASRRVTETDDVRAKHIRQDADQSLTLNSEIGSLKSSSVLKIDGGQIHMG